MNTQTTKMLRTALYTAAMAAMLGSPAPAQLLKAVPHTAATASCEAAVSANQDDKTSKLVPSEGALSKKWPAMANGRQTVKEKTLQARQLNSERR